MGAKRQESPRRGAGGILTPAIVQSVTEAYVKSRIEHDKPVDNQEVGIILRWTEMTMVNDSLLSLILKGHKSQHQRYRYRL